MNPPPAPDASVPPRPPAVVASLVENPDGTGRAFRLTHGTESTVLEPGHTWFQIDHHKWVTRGLIEAPQSFAVHPDGSLDYNGEAFRPREIADAQALTAQVNKRHSGASPTPMGPGKPAPIRSHVAPAAPPGTVVFRVHLDHLGHPVIEARRDEEQTTTGLRGLAHLATDGWIRRPDRLHVDPLQRYVELDGHRFPADPEGAKALEEALNTRYRPAVVASSGAAVEVRDSPGASTGFDIHFRILRAGTRFDIKGHLSQDKLDILQDFEKCGLLKQGTILRLSPPFLYFRRRRSDGGEEAVPGIPDVKYRGISAADLQRLLNHPAIRADAGSEDLQSAPAQPPTPSEGGRQPTPNPIPPTLPPPPTPSPSAPLREAGERPPVVATRSAPQPPRSKVVEPPAVDPVLGRLFAVTDPGQVNREVFRCLSERLHLPPQDVLFSLPRVFDDREFEILSFDGAEIGSVLELRGGRFFGFYLTHLGGERTDLVYACHGTHIEWGTEKCAIQPEAGAETVELRGPGLRGLAQNTQHHFVFIVEPAAREFARHYEKACAAAFAHFVTLDEWAAQCDTLPLIWPRPEVP